MQETVKKWTEAIIPWLLDHGIKIVLIAVAAWLLNKILSRIIIRTVRVAVVADETTSKEGEKKREDTLIRIFNGIVRIGIMILAIMMILQEVRAQDRSADRGRRYYRAGSWFRRAISYKRYYFRIFSYT